MKSRNLAIAACSIALNCDDEVASEWIERELGPFFGGDGRDLSIDLSIEWTGRPPGVAVPETQMLVPLPDGSAIRLEQEAAGGWIGLDVAAYPGEANRRQSQDYSCSFIVNHMFSLMMQQLQRQEAAHILLVHSCGIIRDGAAYLFAGASGRGKSTVAANFAASGEKLLNDDMVIVCREQDRWRAHGSPLGGDLPRQALVNESADLAGIFILGQSERTEWHRLSGPQAAAALIESIIPSYPLAASMPQKIADYDRETVGILLEEAFRLAREIPCFSLSLALGPQPWDEIFNLAQERGCV